MAWRQRIRGLVHVFLSLKCEEPAIEAPLDLFCGNGVVSRCSLEPTQGRTIGLP